MQLAVELFAKLLVAWGRDTPFANMPSEVYDRLMLEYNVNIQLLHQVGATIKPFKLHGFKSKVVEKGGEKEAVETEEPYELWVEIEPSVDLNRVWVSLYDDDANESTVSNTNQTYATESED
eukprot:Selendium_serpulae@DN4916_c0_g1_i2.p1